MISLYTCYINTLCLHVKVNMVRVDSEIGLHAWARSTLHPDINPIYVLVEAAVELVHH